MADDDHIAELALLWWGRAEDDLRVAQRTQDISFACCFHCQQAVEKAIKALLVLHQVQFRRSHDIGELLAQLADTPTPPQPPIIDDLESLTLFAVETRYPPGEATAEEAAEAVAIAARFLDWVKAHMPQVS